MSQIYNLTSDVTVTSFEMRSTPSLNIISARYSGKCVQSFASLSYCFATFSTQMKRGETICPPADGGWCGGPAAAGLMTLLSML